MILQFQPQPTQTTKLLTVPTKSFYNGYHLEVTWKTQPTSTVCVALIRFVDTYKHFPDFFNPTCIAGLLQDLYRSRKLPAYMMTHTDIIRNTSYVSSMTQLEINKLPATKPIDSYLYTYFNININAPTKTIMISQIQTKLCKFMQSFQRLFTTKKFLQKLTTYTKIYSPLHLQGLQTFKTHKQCPSHFRLARVEILSHDKASPNLPHRPQKYLQYILDSHHNPYKQPIHTPTKIHIPSTSKQMNKKAHMLQKQKNNTTSTINTAANARAQR